LKCIQTATARDCSGAHRSAPALPCFNAGHAALARRLTAASRPCPECARASEPPLPSSELGWRAATPAVPPSSGEPTLRPSSSLINRPPSPPSTPPCYRTSLSSSKLTGAPPPSKKHRPATLGEPHRHPSCPVTSPHHPHAHIADRAAREPPMSPGRPRHRVAASAATAGMGRLGHCAAGPGQQC
jgi:hypothetical protein